LRFINLKFPVHSEKAEKNIALKKGSNTILIEDNDLREMLPQIPLLALYGKESSGKLPEEVMENDKFSATVETDINGEKKEIKFVNGAPSGNRNIPEGILGFEDFVLYSYFTTLTREKHADPALNTGRLKDYLLRRESEKESSANIHNFREIIIRKEKEINELKKERELLGLKKRKKDKFVKELSSSERELGKIKKKKESFIDYKNSLNELLGLINEEAKISSKIVNAKNDIIGLRETNARIGELEEEIAQRFPQFTSGMIELLPDLDRLQGEFNSIRDINVQMEKFDSIRKKKISLSLKGITGMLIFAFISMMFILLKAIPLNTITGIILGTISSLLVLLSAATGYYIFLLFRENYPMDLKKRKESTETLLNDLFKNEKFPHNNLGTGELYEYLFQYFEDFLTFRELQNELTAEKKKAGPRDSIKEKEEKLKELTGTKDTLEKDIKKGLKSLDPDIHQAPERDNIKELIPEIDEMISEAEKEEKQKNTITEKIRNEVYQHESGARSKESIDEAIEGIDAEIEKLKKDVKDTAFMQDAYNDAADEWSGKKLETLASKTAEYYGRITKDTGEKPELEKSVKNLITRGNKGEFKPEEITVLTMAVKLALADIYPPAESYPLILVEPYMFDKYEITVKLKKILLELSEKRQVVIITSKSETDLAGNLLII